MSRNINCDNCRTDLGVIRDAKLRKDIVYHCTPCNLSMKDMVQRFEATKSTLNNKSFGDMFFDSLDSKTAGGEFVEELLKGKHYK